MLPISEICVCIATYRRPTGLQKLLQSLVEQDHPPAFSVVVVDNDREQSARPVAEAFEGLLMLQYCTEPTRGLARVRNRAVTESESKFVAFIDDDEWATVGWLGRLYRVAQETNADAIIGPVRVNFAEDVPQHIRDCHYFQTSTLPDGAIVPWYLTRTSNALVRRASLPHQTEPFSYKFDLTGGEDIDLFSRMIESGGIIRASASALVYEDRPLRRANMRWLLRRALRNGVNKAQADVAVQVPVNRLRSIARAGLRSVKSALAAGVLWGFDRHEATSRVIEAGEALGAVVHAFGLQVDEYRNHS